MSEAIIILSEEPLGSIDIDNIKELYSPEDDVELLLLVPAETKRNLLLDVLDSLTLLNIPAAVKEIADRPDSAKVQATAQETLAASLKALAATGKKVQGHVTEGDAVAALIAAVKDNDARQAVVITEPRVLEDTFRQDWASQAQRKLGLPVLHLYAGTGFIGES